MVARTQTDPPWPHVLRKAKRSAKKKKKLRTTNELVLYENGIIVENLHGAKFNVSRMIASMDNFGPPAVVVLLLREEHGR